MQLFSDENSNLAGSSLKQLDQLLNQPVLDVEQVKKTLSYVDKTSNEQILQKIQDKLFQIAINLPAKFNHNDILLTQEDPRTTLKKIGDLLLHCANMFGMSDSIRNLLNHVRTLIGVNGKIESCLHVRQAFFQDLSTLRKMGAHATAAGLRDIYPSMKEANDEAIQVAMTLYS